MADGQDGANIADSAIGTDVGGKSAKVAMARQCAVTRKVLPRSHLIRFVAGPDGQAVPDLKAVLPGRGVWISADPDVLADAIKRKAFARGLKAQVAADATLVGQVGSLLKERALSALSMAKKAGRLVIGQANIITALDSGADVLVLISSDDASEDGLRKIVQADKRRNDGVDTLLKAQVFSGVELDLAFGRSNVIHAALLSAHGGSKAAKDGIWEPLERYLRFLGVVTEQSDSTPDNVELTETNGEPGKADE